MKDLVSLLQGRDFETKDFKESIAEETFKNLSNGVLDYMNEYNLWTQRLGHIMKSCKEFLYV